MLKELRTGLLVMIVMPRTTRYRCTSKEVCAELR